MKNIWPIIVASLIIFGGVALWKYSGTDSAVRAQNEIREKGFYYNGEAWVSPKAYEKLKQSLSTRDPSIQTSNDLGILPKTDKEGNLLIKYSFFSTSTYENLSKTRDFPTKFKVGFSIIPTVGSILFFMVLIIWAMEILNRRDRKKTDEEGVK